MIVEPTALLLIAHGSRREEANRELVDVATQLKSRGHPIVEASYLELADPTIEAGAAACISAGARTVVLLPYFLSPGKHVVEDLSAAREQLAMKYPDLRFLLAESLGRHPLVPGALEDRAREAITSAGAL
jgi:sirohydrochlorin ferrochelatase